MDDNIIRSSYDKKYVPKNLNKSLKTTTNEENIAEKKAKTTRKRTSTKKTTASKQTSKTVEPKKEKSYYLCIYGFAEDFRSACDN